LVVNFFMLTFELSMRDRDGFGEQPQRVYSNLPFIFFFKVKKNLKKVVAKLGCKLFYLDLYTITN
jgi:hypothetical protein